MLFPEYLKPVIDPQNKTENVLYEKFLQKNLSKNKRLSANSKEQTAAILSKNNKEFLINANFANCIKILATQSDVSSFIAKSALFELAAKHTIIYEIDEKFNLIVL